MGDVISAFGRETTARLSGLSSTQLVAWDKLAFFAPSFAHEDRTQRHSRVYTFKDVLALKIRGILKAESGVSTGHLKVAEYPH